MRPTMRLRLSAGALVLALALTAAAAAERIRQLNTLDWQNQTICPYRVYTDFDPDRVPAHIRITVCSDEPLEHCRSGRVPAAECCDLYHGDRYFECVELRETVLVGYKGRDQRSTFEVPVGCACLIGQVFPAGELPSGPVSRRLALGLV